MKYFIVAKKMFKSQTQYAKSTVFTLISSLLAFFVQINLWTALIATGASTDITLTDMVTFILINTFVMAFGSANVATELEPTIRDGSVVYNFIRPVSFKYYTFSEIIGKNLYSVLTSALLVIVIGFWVYNPPLPDFMNAMYFVVSLLIGYGIILEFTYIFGLLAFFTQRAWYINWYLRALLTLFGGTVIPLWFYPQAMNTVSYFLPFRYVSFEPINFFLGKVPQDNALVLIAVAFVWLIILNVISACIFKIVQSKLTVNGG